MTSRALLLCCILVASPAPVWAANTTVKLKVDAKSKGMKGDFLRINAIEEMGPVSWGLQRQSDGNFATFSSVGTGVRRYQMTKEEYDAFVKNNVAPVLKSLKQRAKGSADCRKPAMVEWRLAKSKITPVASKSAVTTCLTEPDGAGVLGVTRLLYQMMMQPRKR
jgi:hypothetical protein